MRCVSALDILNERNVKLLMGCKNIDDAIGGFGKGIVEIAGEAGCGKTQFCLHLAIRCQMDIADGGLSGSCAYLCCGEGEFPIRRLQQISNALSPKFPSKNFLGGVLIEQISNFENLQESLEKRLPDLCIEKGVKLIIVDSIAGVFRNEFAHSTEDMRLRTHHLFRLSQKLKWLSDTFSVVVVVINQVTSVLDDELSRSSLDTMGFTEDIDTSSFNRYYYPSFNDPHTSAEETSLINSLTNRPISIPSLGLAWSHCVNVRILLFKKTGRSSRDSSDKCISSVKRLLHVYFSPGRPCISCGYSVVEEGIVDDNIEL